MKTASWFTPLPDDHQRIGISRGTPRRQPAGFRIYRRLAPGPWFSSVDELEYIRRYQTEILDRLDPRVVTGELADMAGDRVPVLLCFERPGTGSWCHRALVAAWLGDALGLVVPEVGFEALPQQEHPLLPPSMRALLVQKRG